MRHRSDCAIAGEVRHEDLRHEIVEIIGATVMYHYCREWLRGSDTPNMILDGATEPPNWHQTTDGERK